MHDNLLGAVVRFKEESVRPKTRMTTESILELAKFVQKNGKFGGQAWKVFEQPSTSQNPEQ
jgi:hypothetical protein